MDQKNGGALMESTCLFSKANGARYAARVALHYLHVVFLVVILWVALGMLRHTGLTGV